MPEIPIFGRTRWPAGHVVSMQTARDVDDAELGTATCQCGRFFHARAWHGLRHMQDIALQDFAIEAHWRAAEARHG